MSEEAPIPSAREANEARLKLILDSESEKQENLFDIPGSETVSESENTPKEWREKLRGLVMGERAEWLVSYLKDRSAKLDASASELGMVEKSFRALGERYNKLGWKSKLGVGLALGVGSAAFSGVSLPIAFACASGLALQRAAGMASVFLKCEKKWKALGKEGGLLAQKEKAMLKAILYSVGMSLAIGEAVSLASESSYGEAVHEWLKQHWPSGQVGDIGKEGTESVEPQTPQTDASSVTSTGPEPEVQQPEAVPPTETPSSAAPAPEEASVSIDAELADNPEAKGIDAESVASADTETAKLVAKEWGVEYAEPETVPEDLSAKEWRAEYAEPVDHIGAADWRAPHTEADFAPDTATPETVEPLTSVEATPQAQVAEEAVAPQNVIPTDAPEAPTPAEAAPTQPEMSPATVNEANHLIVNAHGIEVETSEPHIYADEGREHMFVYGGSPDQQARLIGQYFENPAHANHTLYGADASNVSFRVPWHLVNGEVLPGEPVRTGGLFGFFSSFMEPPRPDEFAEIVQLRPSEIPVTAINPDDIPRAEMSAPNTGDEFSRPEMQLDKQNIPLSPDINPHPLGHVESGSTKGEFGYSPDGVVTSLNVEGISHGEFKTLLTDDYGTVLLNRPGGNHGLAMSVVENRARDIFNRMQVLDELTKRGASGSPEADFIRKGIKFAVEQTEKMYGNVFKDMHSGQ